MCRVFKLLPMIYFHPTLVDDSDLTNRLEQSLIFQLLSSVTFISGAGATWLNLRVL